ncbi:MAG TPA: hypothetical protein VG938_07035 [Verrucomicrobiae bacterium]|nr:hypothetical protein [Verrucomicrobiae bacterium]
MSLLNIKTRALGIVAVVVVAGARAADLPDSVSPDSVFTLSLQSPRPQAAFFWQRFDDGFADNANDIFSDALRPLNVIQWNLDLRGKDFSDSFRRRAASQARSAFYKSIEYGTREAAVELPIMLWLDERDGWLADLLRGSIDDVDEEAVAPFGLTYESVEQSWWRRLANGGTHYGFRALRTSPYAYVSRAITDGERTILSANLRYYYNHFADHRVELALAVPLAYGMALDFGSAYEFGGRDNRKAVFKLLKEFKGGGIAHVGFEAREHPALIAGISFAW